MTTNVIEEFGATWPRRHWSREQISSIEKTGTSGRFGPPDTGPQRWCGARQGVGIGIETAGHG